MHNDLRLRAPIKLTGDEVEKALFVHRLEEGAFAQVLDQLRGAAAERAAMELNRALEINIFDTLVQAWVKVPSVSAALRLGVLAQSPPAFVNLDRHTVASTSRLVLASSVAQSALPSMVLMLEFIADIQSATLTAREGRLGLLALGDASVVVSIRYKNVLVKEHLTSFAGGRPDPFKRQSTAPSSVPSSVPDRAGVDIEL